MDPARFDALTFDCYGTLIDWETGLGDGLLALARPHGLAAAREEMLELYGRHEAALQAGPYRRYREIVAAALRGVAGDLGFEVGDEVAAAFGESVAEWPAFADSPAALARLAERFRLGVITNCDDDLFAASNRRLGVAFDWVVTAQQVGAYKPDERMFHAALKQMGLPRERILHVAQSLFHDHVPAKRLGMATVWIDRRHGREGAGATPPARARPDATFTDLESFALQATRAHGV